MYIRVVCVVVGIFIGLCSSQVPEFSQQYMQRLGGAVDALGEVVADFDASAAAEELSREAALAQMTGSAFVERRRADMTRTIDRHARLASALEALRDSGPFLRAYHVARLDGEIAKATWRQFQPAMPLTAAGLVFGIAGFVATWLLVVASLKLLGWRRAPA